MVKSKYQDVANEDMVEEDPKKTGIEIMSDNDLNLGQWWCSLAIKGGLHTRPCKCFLVIKGVTHKHLA